MIDLGINKEQLEKNISTAAVKDIILPTIAQLRIPDLIPRNCLTRAYFRKGWYCDQETGIRKSPVFWEVPETVSGVPCRILALLGDAQRDVEFGCFLPKLVSGQVDWEDGAMAEPAVDLSAAIWHYNVTGWALADVYESEKRSGDKLFGACFAAAENGITAAGDLIKGRYPGAKLAVGSVSKKKEPQKTCNAKNLDILCETTDALQCAVSVAKYFELGEHDVLLTILPKERSSAAETCAVHELTYPEKKELCGETKGESGTRGEAFWAACYDQVMVWDQMINEFNDCAAKQKKDRV